MFQEQPKPPEKPPCAVCGAPAPLGWWNSHLCSACHARWFAETKPLQALELAHADAHPEDVESQGVLKYPATGQVDARWVILKPGITVRIARDAARAWLTAQRKARAA